MGTVGCEGCTTGGRKRSTNCFSAEVMSVEEAVVGLCWFPDLGSGVEHVLHLKMLPGEILQQSGILQVSSLLYYLGVTYRLWVMTSRYCILHKQNLTRLSRPYPLQLQNSSDMEDRVRD